MWRRIGFVGVAVLVMGGLAACDPPPSPIVIEVNSFAAGRDVNPGDGVCETMPGNGECTVVAAIDEGDAVGRAVVQVPDSTGEPENIVDPVSVSGDLTLVGEGSDGAEHVWFTELRVEPGATLRMESMLVVSEKVLVQGTLVVDRTFLVADNEVASSGRMVALNSVLFGYGDMSGPLPVVENHGLFWMRYSTVAKDAPILHTAPGATTLVGASAFTGVDAGACTGAAVVSEGYNEDGSPCVDGPTDDVSGANSIPVGELGCGTGVVVDIDGDPRPGPDDPASRVGCTPGPVEW